MTEREKKNKRKGQTGKDYEQRIGQIGIVTKIVVIYVFSIGIPI
jgi:hypothetical protein